MFCFCDVMMFCFDVNVVLLARILKVSTSYSIVFLKNEVQSVLHQRDEGMFEM